MINEILRVIFKLFFFLVRWIFNIVLLPFTLILNTITPEFSSYLSYAQSFVNDYLFKGVAFCKEVFLNMTGFPQEFLTISADIFIAMIGIIGTLKAITFIINMWRFVKGGSTNG